MPKSQSQPIDILAFTSSGKGSDLEEAIKFSLDIISSGEETVVYVYPSIPDILSASIFISKVAASNTPLAVRLEPLIDAVRVKNVNLISIGVPLSKKQYDEIARKSKKALILGLCVKGLSKSKGNASIICSTKYSGTALYTWKILRDKLDIIDYLLLLSSLIASNMFRVPKDTIEKSMLNDAINKGVIEESKGVRIFGISNKPLYKALTESLIPYLYGLTGNEGKCREFVRKHGIDDLSTKLTDHEASTIKKVIEDVLELANKVSPNMWKVEDLIGETYSLKNPVEGFSDDLLEFSAQISAIIERAGYGASAYIRSFFDTISRMYAKTYYDALKNVSSVFERILKEPLRELEVGGRKVKVVKTDTDKYVYMLESVVLTSGYADESDVLIFEGDKGFMITYSTIKRVFLANSYKAIEVFSKASDKQLAKGFIFSSLKNIISSLRRL